MKVFYLSKIFYFSEFFHDNEYSTSRSKSSSFSSGMNYSTKGFVYHSRRAVWSLAACTAVRWPLRRRTWKVSGRFGSTHRTVNCWPQLSRARFLLFFGRETKRSVHRALGIFKFWFISYSCWLWIHLADYYCTLRWANFCTLLKWER